MYFGVLLVILQRQYSWPHSRFSIGKCSSFLMRHDLKWSRLEDLSSWQPSSLQRDLLNLVGLRSVLTLFEWLLTRIRKLRCHCFFFSFDKITVYFGRHSIYSNWDVKYSRYGPLLTYRWNYTSFVIFDLRIYWDWLKTLFYLLFF